MADRIDELVEHAMQYTLDLLMNDALHWSTAKEGLARMLFNLELGAPHHASVLRLQSFINQQDAIYELGGSRH